MNEKLNWLNLSKYFYVLSEDFSDSASEPLRISFLSKAESTTPISMIELNPLYMLPFNIRESINSEFYEPGMSSMAQQYIETIYLSDGKGNDLQKLFNDIYFFAVKKDKHVLAYNIIVVLSQIPYKYLGSWACTLAMAATRNKYMDVVELGVRCFENWENKDACSFLKQCNFSELWLQKYANEVCTYVEEEGQEDSVLFEKDYTWQMARGGSDSIGNIERYTSGYSSSRVQNRSK